MELARSRERRIKEEEEEKKGGEERRKAGEWGLGAKRVQTEASWGGYVGRRTGEEGEGRGGGAEGGEEEREERGERGKGEEDLFDDGALNLLNRHSVIVWGLRRFARWSTRRSWFMISMVINM